MYYNDLKMQYLNSTSITRNKSIIVPVSKKRISDKNCYLKAISVFNALPNNLKVLEIGKSSQINIIKEWIKSNC